MPIERAGCCRAGTSSPEARNRWLRRPIAPGDAADDHGKDLSLVVPTAVVVVADQRLSQSNEANSPATGASMARCLASGERVRALMDRFQSLRRAGHTGGTRLGDRTSRIAIAPESKRGAGRPARPKVLVCCFTQQPLRSDSAGVQPSGADYRAWNTDATTLVLLR